MKGKFEFSLSTSFSDGNDHCNPDTRVQIIPFGEDLTLRLITSAIELSNEFREQLASCQGLYMATAWASAGFPEYDALRQAHQKIKKAVIGTHFYQTAPEFIERFAQNRNVRFVMNHSGVFHPKLYVFKHQAGGWACIVGSANFTAGGFMHNQEASVLITSADGNHGRFCYDSITSINAYWREAVPGNDINLNRYREMQKRFSQTLAHAGGQFGTGRPGRAYEQIDVLNLSWEEFLSRVQHDPNHKIERRLFVLEEARRLFRQHGHFENMPVDDRQGIAGFGNEDLVPWGWFGSMRGAGVFMNIVNNNPGGLSDALDQVPLNGQITREDYINFKERFISSFPLNNAGIQTRHGLATATRLLAMKRPDYFVCLDRANRDGLLRDFDVNVPLHDYEGYWDKIVERLKLATWWNARRPTEAQAGKVWDGRAAMIDAIYYTPV